MAQGSIIWRCRTCGNKSSGTCKHPRARYSIVYYVGKRQKWETVGRVKKDAQHRLAEVMSEIHQGTFRSLKPVLFCDFAVRWLHYVQGRIKPLTLRSYEQLVRRHMIPAFGNLPLSQITPEAIEALMTACRSEKGLSPRTTNYTLMVLKLILKHARQMKLLRENPSEHIKALRNEIQEMDFLTPEEIRLLLRHADEPYRTLFLTAVLTGMRQGELLSLQWGDIDWQRHSLHVRRNLFWYNTHTQAIVGGSQSRWWRFSSPKTRRSIRSIVMSPRLKEALELHRLSCPRSPHDLVFCYTNGNPIDGQRMYEQEFRPALRRAGLRHIRFHDLRHTYTTLMIAQGVHVKFIQSQLGHASIQTTLDRYGHLLPEASRESGEQLDKLIFGPKRPGMAITA